MLNYIITNAPTCFGASATSSGSFDIVFDILFDIVFDKLI